MENLNDEMFATSNAKRGRQATENHDMAVARRRKDDLANVDRGNAVDDKRNDVADAIPHTVRHDCQHIFSIGEKLGKGAFGQVHVGRIVSEVENWSAGTEMAIKFENQKSTGCVSGPPSEWKIYESLTIPGVPKVYYKGKQGNYYYMIMEKLGPSLWRARDRFPNRFDSVIVASIAIEAISILESLHSRGFVHGDIKPENMLFGLVGTPNANKLFLVDLGLAIRWSDEQTGLHVEYDQRPDRLRGTLQYASVHANLGRTSSRRDDLESLAYSLIFLLCGSLPWQNYHGANKHFQVCKIKMEITPAILCYYCPQKFTSFVEEVSSLMFDEEPKYAKYISLFTSLTGLDEANWPITSHGTWKNILEADSKQIRNSLDEVQSCMKKNTRIGTSSSEWIIVFCHQTAMTQRFAYDVETENLYEHLGKIGNTGYYVRSAVCVQNRWALTIDDCTEFTSQIFQLQPFSLNENWIARQWENDYYITAIAGADNGCALVIMSKGVSYTHQCYTVCDSFPYTWIKTKWQDLYWVTCMATSGSKWAVVMSRNAEFTDQTVEIDFMYPSEGIKRRWEKDYRITTTAATTDQVALIFSKYSEMPVDLVQHTCCTPNFPEAEAMERRENNIYIMSMCYGRTIL